MSKRKESTGEKIVGRYWHRKECFTAACAIDRAVDVACRKAIDERDAKWRDAMRYYAPTCVENAAEMVGPYTRKARP